MEYAIIGVLIGIGLISSLVTTKGSLNAVFGQTATQMMPSPSAQASARSGYWQEKTLASNSTVKSVSSRMIKTSLTYSDGSKVSLQQEMDANGVLTGCQFLKIDDYATKVTTFYYTNSDGSIHTFEQDYYKTMPPNNNNQTLAVMGLYSQGVLTNVRTNTYNGSSTATSSITASPMTAYTSDVANAAMDLSYFLTYVPPGI